MNPDLIKIAYFVLAFVAGQISMLLVIGFFNGNKTINLKSPPDSVDSTKENTPGTDPTPDAGRVNTSLIRMESHAFQIQNEIENLKQQIGK